MSRPIIQQEDLERGRKRGMSSTSWPYSHHFKFLTYIYHVDYRSDSQSLHYQPLEGESNFGDSSGPFFSIHSKVANVEDQKMVDRWQKDADGILIFVSPRVGIHISFLQKLEHYRLVCSLLHSLSSFP